MILKLSRHLLRQQSRFAIFEAIRNNSNSSEVHLSYLAEDKQKGIGVIGLNKPETRNAFSRSLVAHMSDALDVLANDRNVRVVVIKSEVPNVFCAGADLKERATFSPAEVQQFVGSLGQLFRQIERLPVPVIGAIDGAAFGGGLEMALACDMRTVSSNTTMGLVETRLAIIPGAGGTQRLARLIGPALAKELIFTARILKSHEAKEMGIANHVVAQNEANDAAYQKAIEIATEMLLNGPISMRMAKKAIDNGLQVDLSTGLAIEEACYAQVIPTADRLEGLKAFMEKRKPKYKGE